MGIPSAARLAAVFEKAEALATSLTFKHLCDIYKPNDLALISGDIQVSDFSRNLTRAYTGLASWYEPTAIFDHAVTGAGLQEEVNIFTSDRWNLPASASDVSAMWVIVMKTPGHALYGRAWVVEGNATTNDYAPIKIPQRIWVLAKLGTGIEIPA